MSHENTIKHLEQQIAKIEEATGSWRSEAEHRKESYEDALQQVSERENLIRQYWEAINALRNEDRIQQDLAE